MIQDRQQKIDHIVNKIRNSIGEINTRYRTGPDLYFYRRLLTLRQQAQDLATFLKADYNIEILYATLVSWDMNSRAAKMLYFNEFKDNILSSLNDLQRLETLFSYNQPQADDVLATLETIYSNLKLMKGQAKLVSNSKVLHFLLPANLAPMDGKNTLHYFYGNSGESSNKYMEITN